VTDCPVLAEEASKIAAGKKYRARTMGPDKRSFFSKVRVPAGYIGAGSGATEALFTLRSVHSARAGAQGTVFEENHCSTDFFLQGLSGKFEVCGYEALIRFFVQSMRPVS
jgi:hypothetical protein